jgi:hypothetical protein
MGSRIRLLGLAALFTLVTACGGGGESDDGVASLDEPAAEKDAGEEKLSDEDQMLKYTECLRENGVDVEDPPAGGGGGGVALPAMPVDDVEGNAAFEKCEEHLPNGGEPEELSPEDLDEMRKQAKCMRDHGFDVPDPTAENPMMEFNDNGDSEGMQKAMEACGFGISVEGAPAEGGK